MHSVIDEGSQSFFYEHCCCVSQGEPGKPGSEGKPGENGEKVK